MRCVDCVLARARLCVCGYEIRTCVVHMKRVQSLCALHKHILNRDDRAVLRMYAFRFRSTKSKQNHMDVKRFRSIPKTVVALFIRAAKRRRANSKHVRSGRHNCFCMDSSSPPRVSSRLICSVCFAVFRPALRVRIGKWACLLDSHAWIQLRRIRICIEFKIDLCH